MLLPEKVLVPEEKPSKRPTRRKKLNKKLKLVGYHFLKEKSCEYESN
jgi:hypothetical protein